MFGIGLLLQVQAAQEAPHAMGQDVFKGSQGSRVAASGTMGLTKDVPCSSKASCKYAATIVAVARCEQHGPCAFKCQDKRSCG